MMWLGNVTDLPPPANQSSVTVDYLQDLQCNNLLKFLINSICAGALCIIGFLGNILSYLVLGRDQEMLPVARLLLRSLAVADNTFLLLWFVQFSVNDLLVYTGIKKAIDSATWLYLRLTTYPILFMGQTATIWLTVLIAATRYVIVCHPTRGTLYCSLEATRKGVAAVVLFSIVYNLPRFFDVQVMRDGNETLTYYLDHTDLGRNTVYNFLYMDAMYYIFGFILPLLLLSIFNIHLIVAYRNFRRKRIALRMRTGPDDSDEQNVTLIMIVIILVFMICNAPAKSVQIFLTYREQRCMTGEFFAREISIVFELLNSSVNFIIYCVGLKRFQDHLPCVSTKTSTIEMEKYQLTGSTTSGKMDEISASV